MTTPKKSVDIICQCRKGSMDDKQFRATVQHNIDLLIQTERQKREEMVEAERKELTVIKSCLLSLAIAIEEGKIDGIVEDIQYTLGHISREKALTQPNNK